MGSRVAAQVYRNNLSHLSVGDTALAHIRRMLPHLQELKQRVLNGGELAEQARVLAAVLGGMDGMQGHVYVCPNGHPYVIGECGGAMQRSRCIECGAEVGGGGHRLQADNRPATELLQQFSGLRLQR